MVLVLECVLLLEGMSEAVAWLYDYWVSFILEVTLFYNANATLLRALYAPEKEVHFFVKVDRSAGRKFCGSDRLPSPGLHL